jgi:hypothetical protein
VDKAVFNLSSSTRAGTKRVEPMSKERFQDPDGTYAVWSFWATPRQCNKKTLQVCVVRHHDDWDNDRDALVRLASKGSR